MSVAIMLAFTLVAVTFLLHYRLLLWSASFTFLAMGWLWPWDNRCGQALESEIPYIFSQSRR